MTNKKFFAPIFVMWWRFWAFGWYWRPHRLQPTFRVLVIGLGPLRIVMNRRRKLEGVAAKRAVKSNA